MRPHKRVLLCCEDEAQRGLIRFALVTRLYAVWATSPVSALHVAAAGGFDCAVVMDSHAPDRSEGLVVALRAALPDVPVMLVLQDGPPPPSVANVVRIGCDMAVIFDSLRVLCARKRGPKKRPAEAVDERAVA